MGRGGQPYEITKGNFNRWLWVYLDPNPIAFVLTETSFQLSEHDSPMPDVAVVLAGRLQPSHTGLIRLSPDIAIEVVSSEPAAVLQAKIRLYLEHGTKAVWVAYPELRILHIYDAKGVRELAGKELLEAPEILPGFSVPVAAFFEGL